MTNTNPAWGTTKTHGKPAQAMFYGQDVKAPWAEGVLVNITIDRSGFEALNADGKRIACGGVATRYWAAPVTTTPEEVVTTTILPKTGAKRAPRAKKVTFSAENAMVNHANAEAAKKTPQAKPPQTRQMARAELLATRKAAAPKADKAPKAQPQRPTAHDKANDLVRLADSLGWTGAAEKGETSADLVTFRAHRDGEEVTLHWIVGGTRPGTHTNGGRNVQAMNAATVKRILATPAQAAAQVRAAYASGKGKAKRAAVKVASSAPLALNLAEATDDEVLAALQGKTVTWTNSISGAEETATVSGTGKTKAKILGEGDKRAIAFSDKVLGFRTARLSSISSVN